jgi:phosphoribosylformylglycinamidine synthase subunit PurL
MAQITGCLEGMADACRALDFPIVSGNVSLYNESKATGGGSAILPTPAIGGVGLISDWRKAVGIGFKGEDQPIFVIGRISGYLGQSLYVRQLKKREIGEPPSVDLVKERLASELVRSSVQSGLVNCVHDCSDGGILVAIAEMALTSGIGADIESEGWGNGYANLTSLLFGEEQGRYVCTSVSRETSEQIRQLAEDVGLDFVYIGDTGGNTLHIGSDLGMSRAEIPLADLRAAHEGFFPKLMDE